jgi:hypothetical protein
MNKSPNGAFGTEWRDQTDHQSTDPRTAAAVYHGCGYWSLAVTAFGSPKARLVH